MKSGRERDRALEQALLDATAQARCSAPSTLRSRILRSLEASDSNPAHNLSPSAGSKLPRIQRFSPAGISALAAGVAGLIFAAVHYMSAPDASAPLSHASPHPASVQSSEPSALSSLKRTGPALGLLAPDQSLAAAEKPLVEEIRKLRTDGSSMARAMLGRLPAPLDQLLGLP